MNIYTKKQNFFDLRNVAKAAAASLFTANILLAPANAQSADSHEIRLTGSATVNSITGAAFNAVDLYDKFQFSITFSTDYWVISDIVIPGYHLDSLNSNVYGFTEWYQWLTLDYKGTKIISATGWAFEQQSFDTSSGGWFWEAEQSFESYGPYIKISSYEYEEESDFEGGFYYYIWQGYSATGKITNVFVDGIEVPRESIIADVPEPLTWALLITGFGLVGTAARRRNASSHTMAGKLNMDETYIS